MVMKQRPSSGGSLVLFGCGTDLAASADRTLRRHGHQPKYKPQTRRSAQRPLPGTVAQGQLKKTTAYSRPASGKRHVHRQESAAVTAELLARGQERFNIYCAPCHDQTGSGHGIVALRGNWLPTNLLESARASMTDGEIFQVISNGRRVHARLPLPGAGERPLGHRGLRASAATRHRAAPSKTFRRNCGRSCDDPEPKLPTGRADVPARPQRHCSWWRWRAGAAAAAGLCRRIRNSSSPPTW